MLAASGVQRSKQKHAIAPRELDIAMSGRGHRGEVTEAHRRTFMRGVARRALSADCRELFRLHGVLIKVTYGPFTRRLQRALPSRTLSVSFRSGSQPRSTRSVTASPACRSSTAESKSSTWCTGVPSTWAFEMREMRGVGAD